MPQKRVFFNEKPEGKPEERRCRPCDVKRCRRPLRNERRSAFYSKKLYGVNLINCFLYVNSILNPVPVHLEHVA